VTPYCLQATGTSQTKARTHLPESAVALPLPPPPARHRGFRAPHRRDRRLAIQVIELQQANGALDADANGMRNVVKIVLAVLALVLLLWLNGCPGVVDD
jgi:hypothetical protein